MIHLVTVIHIIACLLLVPVVLMQQGKKDGMGAAFGGGSQSVFGARGAETFLEKFTKVLAVVFMCTSLTLVYFSSKSVSNSIFSNEKTTSEAPKATDAPKAGVEPIQAGTKPPVESAAKPANDGITVEEIPADSAPKAK